jgi:hypothetical protein
MHNSEKRVLQAILMLIFYEPLWSAINKFKTIWPQHNHSEHWFDEHFCNTGGSTVLIVLSSD